MLVFPIIHRELLSESRNPVNVWLRVLTACLVFALALLSLWAARWSNPSAQGHDVFIALHATVFTAIWFLIPILAHDTISRERRDGTLNLLFLTPLKPLELALSKGFFNLWRCSMLLLAAIPVFTVPLLLGGVSIEYMLRAALMNFMAVFAATGATLLASVLFKSRNRSLTAAILLSILAGILLSSVSMFSMQPLGYRPNNLLEWIGTAWCQSVGVDSLWMDARSRNWGWNTPQPTPAVSSGLLAISLIQCAAGLGFLIATAWIGGWLIQRGRSELPMTPRQLKWWRFFCSPRFFTTHFKRRMRHRMDRNPIGWIQLRTWSARVTGFGWAGVLIVVETYLVSHIDRFDALIHLQFFLAAGLGLTMALSAAGSFRSERESGAFELLLVTPLSIHQVIEGRLRGLWLQYLPALFFLELGWWSATMYLGSFGLFWWSSGTMEFLLISLIFATSWLAIPCIGLYQSLVRRHLILGSINTMLFGFAVPAASAFILMGLLFMLTGAPLGLTRSEQEVFRFVGWITITVLFQVVFAVRSLIKLHTCLEHRDFTLPG